MLTWQAIHGAVTPGLLLGRASKLHVSVFARKVAEVQYPCIPKSGTCVAAPCCTWKSTINRSGQVWGNALMVLRMTGSAALASRYVTLAMPATTITCTATTKAAAAQRDKVRPAAFNTPCWLLAGHTLCMHAVLLENGHCFQGKRLTKM